MLYWTSYLAASRRTPHHPPKCGGCQVLSFFSCCRTWSTSVLRAPWSSGVPVVIYPSAVSWCLQPCAVSILLPARVTKGDVPCWAQEHTLLHSHPSAVVAVRQIKIDTDNCLRSGAVHQPALCSLPRERRDEKGAAMSGSRGWQVFGSRPPFFPLERQHWKGIPINNSYLFN